MILSTANMIGDLEIKIYKSFRKDYDNVTKGCIIFQLDAHSSRKKDLKDTLDFEMKLEDVKQLHSFLGNILKTEWAKQKH